MKRLRLWWKWRKVKVNQYPFRYVGPTTTLRGTQIEYGTPLRLERGGKGIAGGARYTSPDGILRLLPVKQIETR